MQKRAALVLVVITPALLITSCKSTSKSKLTTLPAKLSASAIAPATTAPAPATSSSSTPIPLPPPPATSAPASPSPSPTPTASAPASPTGSAKPTTLDPCQLVTQDEASTIAKATFGPGKEETTDGGGKICVYGSQTKNVFTVLVAQAADAAAAKAEWNSQLAVLETKLSSGLPPSVHVTFDTSNISALGDEAVTVTGGEPAAGINFNGVYVLSGPTFFLIGDLVLNQPPASIDDLKTQAQTALGRI